MVCILSLTVFIVHHLDSMSSTEDRAALIYPFKSTKLSTYTGDDTVRWFTHSLRFTLVIVDHAMIGYYRNRRVPNPDLVEKRRDTGLQEDLQRKGILMQSPETRD